MSDRDTFWDKASEAKITSAARRWASTRALKFYPVHPVVFCFLLSAHEDGQRFLGPENGQEERQDEQDLQDEEQEVD